jgi:hypothetical protein
MTQFSLTRLDVFPVPEPTGICDYAFACEQIIETRTRLSDSHANRPDTVGITKRNDAKSCQHSDAGISSLALRHQPADSGEDIVLIDPNLARLLQIIGKNVEKQFRIGRRIDVSVGGLVQKVTKDHGVDQIPILIGF